ncbi:MAG: fimbrillin family protein [Candidatus Cryptobacteroides sp.]
MKRTVGQSYPAILQMALALITTTLVFSACSEKAGKDSSGESVEELPPEIRLAPMVTKVSDDCFELGDRIGVFMSYASPAGTDSGEEAVPLPYLDNEPFVCTEGSNSSLSGSGASFVCQSGKTLRWKDAVSPADFICYYPYSEDADGCGQLPFNVLTDQSSSESLSASDILWGARRGVEPTSEYVGILTEHRTGQILIELVPGKGYDAAGLQEAMEGLVIRGGICRGVLDLATGALTVPESSGREGGTPSLEEDSGSGSLAEDVIPFAEGLKYRALLPPQRIEDLVISVRVDGMDRSLASLIELVSGHVTRCTVIVDRLADGINVGIGAWVDDGEDFGGVLD